MIKVNWGDGKEYAAIVSDKAKCDVDAIKTQMSNTMQPWNNVYYANFFRGYKDVKGRIYVGEMTFHPGCGYESFYPEDWNVKVGDMLRLPERNIY